MTDIVIVDDPSQKTTTKQQRKRRERVVSMPSSSSSSTLTTTPKRRGKQQLLDFCIHPHTHVPTPQVHHQPHQQHDNALVTVASATTRDFSQPTSKPKTLGATNKRVTAIKGNRTIKSMEAQTATISGTTPMNLDNGVFCHFYYVKPAMLTTTKAANLSFDPFEISSYLRLSQGHMNNQFQRQMTMKQQVENAISTPK